MGEGPGLFMLASRRSAAKFWSGAALVTIGVALHLPMFVMGAGVHYVLAGMPMENGMLAGMAAIVAGVLLSGYGLLPRSAGIAPISVPAAVAPAAADRPPDEKLTRAH